MCPMCSKPVSGVGRKLNISISCGYSRTASSVSGVSVGSVRNNRPPTRDTLRGAFRSIAHTATSTMWHQKSMKVPPE